MRRESIARAALVALAAGMAGGAHGAVTSLSTSTPSVGDGVQNLNYSTSAGTNANVQFVPSNYLAGDNAALGQTFTTGVNSGGYSLSAISLRQVSWGTTYWDYNGGNVTLQVFRLDGANGDGTWNITPLDQETAAVGGEDGLGLSNGVPASPMWLTVSLDSPVSLSPNARYGFQIVSNGTGGNDGFFMETDGTSNDTYAGGFALGTATVGGQPQNGGAIDQALVWDGNNGRPTDRAFVATMTAVPEPAALALLACGAPFVRRKGRSA